jgi:hypothetical protein
MSYGAPYGPPPGTSILRPTGLMRVSCHNNLPLGQSICMKEDRS